MPEASGWEPTIGQPLHPCPVQRPRLASAPERPEPVPGDMPVEGIDGSVVGGNGEVVEPAVHDPLHIRPLPMDRHVHHPPERLFDLAQLRPKPFPHRVPPQDELPRPVHAADVREAKEVEGLRPAALVAATLEGETPEHDGPGLVGVQLQPELLQPEREVGQELARVALEHEAHHGVVGIAHHDHVAVGVLRCAELPSADTCRFRRRTENVRSQSPSLQDRSPHRHVCRKAWCNPLAIFQSTDGNGSFARHLSR